MSNFFRIFNSKSTASAAGVLLAIAGMFLLAAPAPTAQAAFGMSGAEVTFTEADGASATQAGSHPFAFTTSFALNYTEAGGATFPDGRFKDLIARQLAGVLADPTAYPRCSTADFLNHSSGPHSSGPPHCGADTAVGVSASSIEELGSWVGSPVFNLTPPPGALLRLGIHIAAVDVVIDVRLTSNPPYVGLASVRNVPQSLEVFASKLQLWGNPSDPSHDSLRGNCYAQEAVPAPGEGFHFESQTGESCAATANPRPFLTLPTRCTESNQTLLAVDFNESPGAFLSDGEPNLEDPNWITESVELHDEGGSPQPFTGCDKLSFKSSITATPTTRAASSPTGLDFALEIKDEGLTSVSGLAQSDIRKAVVTLPEGMSANPSLAEGLEVCTMDQLDRERLSSEPGEGCPDASKIGTVEVETPLLDETVKGSLFIAKPYENYADNSLIAMYMVIRNRQLGIIVKQPLKVTPDPVTGQLTTVAEELPQLPFSHFRLHFREGARSPLTTPQACGAYDATATFYPWSGTAPITRTSAFQIISGPDEGPCPAGGLPPFKPGLIAGTLNNRAGSFSDFNLRLSRSDNEQEITHFSIKLPPGITGKLAGVPYCSDAAIEQAKARTGPHGGEEELNDPSCPAASQIGRTLAGAGVGPSLAYAPGKVYLAGPYHGSNLSMVAITSGVVGPFDIGTVVVREGFKIDPETAEVFVDSTGSDPIPHIIRGIPVHLRDIRAYVDRPNFVLNPTDCTKTSTASTVLGSGLDFVSEADDNPITVTSPFQAADCAALRFKPQLGLKLIGGTKRGSHPAFKAHLEMTGIGESGIARAEVTLPRSEFIENAHFKTICTRVQFKAGGGNGEQCPADSIYGKATAVTPILGEPLTGPVFLRSSEHQLPDLVVALHNSQVDFDLVGHVDSVKGGGLRNTFETAPDAPVSSFDLEMAGGKKGLFVNSTNLCAKTYRAKAVFTGQNGKVYESKPALKARCPKAKKHKKGKGKKAVRDGKRHMRAARYPRGGQW